MSDYIIKVENLGKKYCIRHQQKQQRYVSLRDVIANRVKRVGASVLENSRHLFSRNGNSNPRYLARDSSPQASKSLRAAPNSELPAAASLTSELRPPISEEFWALKDVSFEVKVGEVVGIIGRNGAGKSTLLKILSRITEPTEGRVRIRGRVASLLEVGTGFHPELTGRENIFVNGAILGMTRAEIAKKFDEIVAFAEIEKFLDTPVKRYSSGMYVRLAFAVAAHLEPEILIVDEVLAVGDAAFQKKCLGKMQDVAKVGRTVLFVSHNMTAVRGLCGRAVVLRNGKLTAEGATEEMVHAYLSQDFCGSLARRWVIDAQAPQGGGFTVLEARLVPVGSTGSARLTVESAFDLVFHVWSDKPARINLSLHFMTPAGETGFAVASPLVSVPGGQTAFRCHVPPNLLNDGTYSIELLVVADSKAEVVVKDVLTFEIDDRTRTGAWMGKWPGFVRPHLNWDYEHYADNAKT